MPAPEEATGNVEDRLPGSISALEACSPWLWGNPRGELSTGEQIRRRQSSPGQCCCAFKDRHVMRSSASHCPPSSWPICHLGFSLCISYPTAILAGGTWYPKVPLVLVFTKIKRREDPGAPSHFAQPPGLFAALSSLTLGEVGSSVFIPPSPKPGIRL